MAGGRSADRAAPALTANAEVLLRERYLRRDRRGRVTESFAAMIDRVAAHVASAEAVHGGDPVRWHEEFATAMSGLIMLPSSPVLMNAGTSLGFLSACVVLPVEDTLDSIFSAVRDMALVHQSGGGTGFSFSHLRPRGDGVHTTHGLASGPVSFMRIFDVATDVVRQGGRRRGANMAVLDVSHPDIVEFVTTKATPGTLQNFNLSVMVPDAFMRAVTNDAVQPLVNPRTHRTVATVKARALLHLIAEQAHAHGDPGMLFSDRINAANPLPGDGRVEATNPCGEVPLLPGESCTLGSVNLARLVRARAVDWDALAHHVRLMVRFLDDVVTVNRYPLPTLRVAALRTRKIGVGVMGFAEMLLLLGIPYDSEAAVELASAIAGCVERAAVEESEALAATRGPFPAWPESISAARGEPPRRNAQLTSIAPTGSISTIAGTTAGIEPVFALAYDRRVLERRLTEVEPHFLRAAAEGGFISEELMRDVAARGGVRGDQRVPANVRRLFVTALEIAPTWHLRIQAAFQRHVDAAVAKTVNLPSAAAVEDVETVFRDAWRSGAKGITVYRHGSRADQVMRLDGAAAVAPGPGLDRAGGCATALCDAE